MKELDIFYLNGNGAYITSTIKGILTGDSSIDMIIYHNYPNTKSNIENKLVTVKDGKVKLNVTTIVYNKIKNCNVNQSNFILKENNLDSTIKPILLIEENEVEASHSAHISSIDPNQLYYIESRGIKEYDAKKLYIKGFLKGDFYNIENNIEKYWR
jgi:Fe-S cluster assembly scaffold protein SufB